VIGEFGGRGNFRFVVRIGGEDIFAHERSEGYGAEAAAGAAQELAAGTRKIEVIAGHGG
jgi:hypothetical protein